MAAPALQHHSDVPRQLSKVADLSDEQMKMCDRLIVRVGEAGGTLEVATDDPRKGLWGEVFAGGWNTKCLNMHPGPIPERQRQDVMIPVCVFTENLGPATPSE
ncbi:hypothetical protein QBC34DRAFT_427043 [Podospora aff. communis PSN243]|uniref:Uncharacterized protein n=1 Tax=Podospora aff. communis PSN243 TaxID=3040156 RepID=A0AAV9GIQ7_9PEZI|nr:hypothetical protein QBC34DRAFT_427043 [Podospora aff. communis PSN243]